MTHSSDEFGPSLEEFFPNLSQEAALIPESETVGDFGSGLTHRLAAPSFKDTHLCAMFIEYKCAHCGSLTLAPQNFAVRRVSTGRNECIEYHAVLPDCLHLFDHLPRYKYHLHHHSDFCAKCIGASGFEREGAPE